MDIHCGSPAVAIPMSSSDCHVGRRRSHTRSDSHSSLDSGSDSLSRPMSIPGAHTSYIPPPLPPPRHIEQLDHGDDITWKFENSVLGKSRGLPSIKIKEGSSLLGQFASPRRQLEHRHNIHKDQQTERRHSTTTVRATAMAESSASPPIPSVTHRAPSPGASNAMLHGERPLAQQNLNRSNQVYDRSMLSRIGKPNSPPHHLHTDSADSPVLPQKLSLQTKDMKSSQQLTPIGSASTADSTGRWPVTSPASTGASPFARQNWRDYNMDPQSPPLDTPDPGTVALDPALFVPRQPLRLSANVPAGGVDEIRSRSARSSYDQAMYTPISEPSEDVGGTRNVNLDENSDKLSMRQGVKRKSPPSEGQMDERLQRELYPKPLTTCLPSRSPFTSYHLKNESVSSTASSAQHASFTSSAAPGSMTSISSYETSSPKDLPRNPAYAMATQITGPIATITSRKVTDRIVPRKSSGHIMPQDIRPAPARIGNHFICACCPKKPKKFETEEQLRAHENEKQYSCNFCHNRFKNKNEAERHQNSLHLRRHSWSCAALANYQAAFSPSGAMDPSSVATDACGYCGEEFPNLPTPDWKERIDHLTNVHKFGECNSAKKFFRADHFRQHLKHSHAGKSGKWTNILEHACVKDETPIDGAGYSISTGEQHQMPITRPGTSLPLSGETPAGSFDSEDLL